MNERPSLAPTAKMQRQQQIRKLEQVLSDELYDLLCIIFELTDDMSFAELARESGLCEGTVRRLWDYRRGEVRYPRFLTIQKLAYAVGLQLTIEKEGIKVSLADAKRKAKRRSLIDKAIAAAA